MRKQKWEKLVFTSMFTALACIATMVIQIPSPMNGYLNLGDAVVLLGAWFLGPAYGAFAGGVGSMLADILSGYAYYAPGTLMIKGLMALAAAVVFQALWNRAGGKVLGRSSFRNPGRVYHGSWIFWLCLSPSAKRFGGCGKYSRELGTGRRRNCCGNGGLLGPASGGASSGVVEGELI